MWVWLFAAFAAPPAAPTVDLAEEADLLFRLGVEEYRSARYTSALEHLLAAHRLVPNRNVAFNIARCYEQLGQLSQAWRHYDQYVRTEPDAAARVEAEAALKRLDGKVARALVTSTPPGATVYVERRDLGSRGVTPLTLALPVGEHELLIELDGREVRTTAKLALGTPSEVGVTFPTAAASPRPDVPRAVDPWVSTELRWGDRLIGRASPDGCTITDAPITVTLPSSARPLVPQPPGSLLAAATPAEGLVLDVTTREGDAVRTRRSELERPEKKALHLEDATALEDWFFATCGPATGGPWTVADAAWSGRARLDVVAVFAEWAAALDRADPTSARACASGDCTLLAETLAR